MNDETIVQNGAADATNDTKHNSTRALRGKIAQLPKDIREELNRRLDDGQTGPVILPWLNGIPAVKAILDKDFGGVPINDRNLSLWRHNGFQRWLEKQESVDELKMLAEDAMDFSEAAGIALARGTASIAAAKILKLLPKIPAEQGSIDELTKISYAVSALLNADQNQVRLEHEKTRVFQGNERLVLSWDKFLRGCVETAQRALNDAIAKDIQAADIDNGEKIELLGYQLFGKKWQGREVGKKEEAMEGPKKESPESAEREKTDVRVPAETMRSKAEPGETATEKTEMNISGGLPTAATVSRAGERAEPKKTDAASEQHKNRHSLRELEGRTCSHVPTVAMDSKSPDAPPNPKQKASVPELSPYEKAILEGQTPLAALYAQFAPDSNAQPKPQEEASAPKPSAWDTFSEAVRVSPLSSRPEPLRPPPGFNTLG